MDSSYIYYSDKYSDEQYEYRYEAAGGISNGFLLGLWGGGSLGRRLSRGLYDFLGSCAPPLAAVSVALVAVGPEGLWGAPGLRLFVVEFCAAFYQLWEGVVMARSALPALVSG